MHRKNIGRRGSGRRRRAEGEFGRLGNNKIDDDDQKKALVLAIGTEGETALLPAVSANFFLGENRSNKKQRRRGE
jgi:hypothetical protein